MSLRNICGKDSASREKYKINPFIFTCGFSAVSGMIQAGLTLFPRAWDFRGGAFYLYSHPFCRSVIKTDRKSRPLLERSFGTPFDKQSAFLRNRHSKTYSKRRCREAIRTGCRSKQKVIDNK